MNSTSAETAAATEALSKESQRTQLEGSGTFRLSTDSKCLVDALQSPQRSQSHSVQTLSDTIATITVVCPMHVVWIQL